MDFVCYLFHLVIGINKRINYLLFVVSVYDWQMQINTVATMPAATNHAIRVLQMD